MCVVGFLLSNVGLHSRGDNPVPYDWLTSRSMGVRAKHRHLHGRHTNVERGMRPILLLVRPLSEDGGVEDLEGQVFALLSIYFSSFDFILFYFIFVLLPSSRWCFSRSNATYTPTAESVTDL